MIPIVPSDADQKSATSTLCTTMPENMRGSRKFRCNCEMDWCIHSEFLTTKHAKATKNGKRIIIKARFALT
jgi:hypothetical protein